MNYKISINPKCIYIGFILFLCQKALYLSIFDIRIGVALIPLLKYTLILFSFTMTLIPAIAISKATNIAVFILPIIMCMISSVRILTQYENCYSFVYLFIDQAYFWIVALFYFYIKVYTYYGSISTSDLVNIVNIISILSLIVWISQYLLSNKLVFTTATIGARYGEPRIYFPTIIIIIMMFFMVDNLINGEFITRSIIGLLSSFYLIAVVEKLRMTLLALAFILLLLCLFINKPMNKIKYGIIFLVGGIVLSRSKIGNDIFHSLFEGTKGMAFREEYRRYFADYILDSPANFFWGKGYVVANSNLANSIGSEIFHTGVYQFFIGDHGVFSFIYTYGFVGIIWLIILFHKMISQGIYIVKNSSSIGRNMYSMILFPVFLLVDMVSELPWYIGNGIIGIAIFLSIQENIVSTIKNGNIRS